MNDCDNGKRRAIAPFCFARVIFYPVLILCMTGTWAMPSCDCTVDDPGNRVLRPDDIIPPKKYPTDTFSPGDMREHFDDLMMTVQSMRRKDLVDNILALSVQMETSDLQWLANFIESLSTVSPQIEYLDAIDIMRARSISHGDTRSRVLIDTIGAFVYVNYSIDDVGLRLLHNATSLRYSTQSRLAYVRALERICVHQGGFTEEVQTSAHLQFGDRWIGDFIRSHSQSSDTIVYAIALAQACLECHFITRTECCTVVGIIESHVQAALKDEDRDYRRDSVSRQLNDLRDKCCNAD